MEYLTSFKGMSHRRNRARHPAPQGGSVFHGLGPATLGGSTRYFPPEQAGIVIPEPVPVPQEVSVFSGYGPVPQGGSPRYVPQPQLASQGGAMGLGGVLVGVGSAGLDECVATLNVCVQRVSNAVSLSPINTVRLSTLEQVQPGEVVKCRFTSKCKERSGALSVKSGDAITVVKWDTDAQWALGSLGEETGLFYKGFCEQFEEPQTEEDPSISPINRSGTRVSFENQDYLCEKSPEDWYSCIICHQLVSQPTQTMCCAQTVCHLCIQTWKETSNTCPQCRKAAITTTPDPRLERQIFDLWVYCPNYIYGCEWEGELRNMKVHSQECEFSMAICPNGCEEAMSAKLLQTHSEQHCLCRQVQCPFCKLSTATEQAHSQSLFGIDKPPPLPFTYEELCSTHHASCTKWPVLCPNACEKQFSLDRSTLPGHLANDCPLAVVPCVFSDVGCEEEVPRRDMELHVESKMAAHLMMMHKGFMRLKLENEELKKMVGKAGHSSQLLQFPPL